MNSDISATFSPIGAILGRLENTRNYNDGWRADCPAREHRSRQTVWISERDDGSVGLHCFAGCSALDVLHAIGLELKDLFPRPIDALNPAEKTKRKQWGKISRYAAALSSLEFAARVIWLAGCHLKSAGTLDETDEIQLNRAIETVEDARRVLNG